MDGMIGILLVIFFGLMVFTVAVAVVVVLWMVFIGTASAAWHAFKGSEREN